MLPSDIAVWLAVGPVDLHWSFDRLCGIVREALAGDPRSGNLFLFFNKRRTHAKVLFFDRGGYCVLHKRLDYGVFPLPTVIEPKATSVALSAEQLALILEGTRLAGAAPRTREPRRAGAGRPFRKVLH